MQQISVYCIECLCGRYIETAKNELDCPECGRKLLIEWHAEIEAARAEAEAKATPAAA